MRFLTILALFIGLTFKSPLSAGTDYKPGPLSVENPALPKGKVTQMEPLQSKLYPGTTRDWFIYVPAQYQANKPACLMVFQDGHDYVNLKGNWRVPTVFDNLIASGAMPVTIAIFINPGNDVDKNPKPQNAWRASNRSAEYDTLGSVYSRFLLEEVIPLVQKDYHLTSDPEGWAIGGASSGGICSFTVAWERPDKFRKVFSTIGSFTNIRGGNAYPYLIRVTEKKPLRIFLQDGRNDLDNAFGNWPLANEMMLASLKFMKYDVNFVQGDGQHDSRHAGSIFPEAMTWLWAGYQPK
jgi:enterochelin esterase-like enzyme